MHGGLGLICQHTNRLALLISRAIQIAFIVVGVIKL
jgi:hypothetical protein